jgi:hypothetical protein
MSSALIFGQSAKDTSWYPKGFDFHIASGMYFGNKYNAAYYNGSAENENNIFYVLNNKYWYDAIFELMQTKHPYISDSVFLVELPKNMRYSTGFSVSIGSKYKFNKNWGLSFNYTFVRLRTTDIFTMDYSGPVSNMQQDRPFIEHLIGTERRSLLEVSASYMFHPHENIKPFIEMGVQFNYTDVREFFALFEEDVSKGKYSLLDIYNGVNWVPGMQIQEYPVRWGGPGYGFVTSVGIKFVFNKYISIDPLFYLSASSIHLTGYKNIALNYGVYIRLIMSDMVFMKRQ